MYVPVLIAIPWATIAEVPEGLDHIANRATKFIGRDLVNDLSEIVLTMVRHELDPILSDKKVNYKSVVSALSKIMDVFKVYSYATSSRIIGKLVRGQLDYAELRDFCREAVSTFDKRIGRNRKRLSLGVAALFDFDLFTLTILPNLGIRKFYSISRKNSRNEFVEAVDTASRLALLLYAALKMFNNEAIYRNLLDVVEEDIDRYSQDLELYLDTLAIELNPEYEDVFKRLARGGSS